ncbi:fish-egg lectin-like isoform X2 [Hemicordylus capensis]|nr:fish-egg lectin-like isoform X2 [Hemicordylus capensis]
MRRILLLLADLVLLNAQLCTEIPGTLKQIDAGNGFVIGLEPTGDAYMKFGEDWHYLAGEMKHVTAGAGGVWMIDNNAHAYRLVGGKLELVSGSFSQIDAGGDLFVAGVNQLTESWCLSRSGLVTKSPSFPGSWANLEGSLIYYSCGWRGCWGINTVNEIWFRHGISSQDCKGTHWEHVPSTFSMVEVGSDGSVFAVKTNGAVYRRDGITDSRPVGTKWTIMRDINAKIKHLAYDLNILWLITEEDKILRCQM